jgi:hypothetical protein
MARESAIVAEHFQRHRSCLRSAPSSSKPADKKDLRQYARSASAGRKLICPKVVHCPQTRRLCLSKILKCLSGGKGIISPLQFMGNVIPQPDHEGKTVGGTG